MKKSLFFVINLIILLIITGFFAQGETVKTAYLTFDDGPSKNTPVILKILDQNGIKATFFVIGVNITKETEPIITKLSLDGHFIGLHTMKHNFTALYKKSSGPDVFVREMLEEQLLIYSLTGKESHLVRPPFSGGDRLSDAYVKRLVQNHFKVWDWNVDSRDWSCRYAGQILKNVNYDLKESKYPDTVVVLMHEQNVSVQALPSVIEILKSHGYRFKVYDPAHHFPMNFRHLDYI